MMDIYINIYILYIYIYIYTYYAYIYIYIYIMFVLFILYVRCHVFDEFYFQISNPKISADLGLAPFWA